MLTLILESGTGQTSPGNFQFGPIVVGRAAEYRFKLGRPDHETRWRRSLSHDGMKTS